MVSNKQNDPIKLFRVNKVWHQQFMITINRILPLWDFGAISLDVYLTSIIVELY